MFYLNFNNLALGIVYKDTLKNLKSVSVSAQNMKDILGSLSLQCYFDDTIRKMLYYNPTEYEYTKMSNRLYSYKNIYPYLNSIYVYNGQSFFVCPGYSTVYSKNDFADKDILKIIGRMDLYRSNTIIPRKIDKSLYSNFTGEAFVYTYLFYDSQKSSGSIGQAIILNVSSDWLKQSIESFSDEDSRILIINEKGEMMIDDSRYPALTNLSGQEYIINIRHSAKESGYFTAKVDGQQSLISYVSANVMDWKFISITPYSQIVAKINNMRNGAFLIGFAILMLGVLVTYYLSRRLFLPVKSMSMEINTYNDEKRMNFYKNKQKMVTGIVMNNTAYKPRQFKEYDIKTDITKPFTLIILKVDNYSRFCANFNLNDRSLMKFGIMNIAGEILSEKFLNECADMDNECILVLLNSRDDGREDYGEISGLLEIIRAKVENCLDLSLSFTIGRRNCPLSDLKEEYGRILEASEYRMIKGQGCILFAYDIRFEPATDFTYPIDKENALIEAMMLGQSEGAKKILREIASYAELFGRSIFDATFLHLLLSISNYVVIIQKNNSITIDFNFNSYLDNIRSMETIQEILDIYFRLFDSISSELEKNKDDRHDKLIGQVMEIINQKYASPDLCLANIADIVNISPYYLSKLFKKYKLVSLSDYINNVRISKAKDLINKGDEPISSIMENTGFISRSHFYTLFKKAYGVSPNQLRKVQLPRD